MINISGLFFYLFSAVLTASALLVIVSRNPVHSVIFLILAFFNAAGLFMLLGAEFLAMILVIVYVGAIAVLFLFIVMMLDVDFTQMREGFLQYLPVGALVGAILLVELLLTVAGWIFTPESTAPVPILPHVSNTQAIGAVLYTQYFHLFQLAGLILLVAMIGAIVLTLQHKAGVKRQNISRQNTRTKNASIEIKHVASGVGIEKL
jgi:NADH-quinone oxidoreductase subunit J